MVAFMRSELIVCVFQAVVLVAVRLTLAAAPGAVVAATESV